jgi:hypothetical protein
MIVVLLVVAVSLLTTHAASGTGQRSNEAGASLANLVDEATGLRTLNYLKQAGDKWVSLRRGPEGLKTWGNALAPAIEERDYTNWDGSIMS